MTKAPGNGGDAVNIPADGIRQSVSWKLRSDGLEEELIVEELSALMDRGGHERDQRGKLIEREAFTEEEIEALSDRVAARMAKLDQVDALSVDEIIRLAEGFAFPLGAFAALSKDLARALNKTITPVFAFLPRKKAIDWAQTEMQRTAKDIMLASEALLRGFDRLERLDTIHAPKTERARRSRYLLSGLLQCGCCGSGYIMISDSRYGCAAARNSGTCTNCKTIRRVDVEARVLAGLKDNLLHPDMIAEFIAEFQREVQAQRLASLSARATAEQELAKVTKEIDNVITAITQGMFHASMKARMDTLEADKARLTAQLFDIPEPEPVIVHPGLADAYAHKVADLATALNTDDAQEEGNRPVATAVSGP